MTTSTLVSSTRTLRVRTEEIAAPSTRAYRTKTSFVAVHFDQPGKGRIVFLPEGAVLRVIGPSSCLREGFAVMFESRTYNVFQIDLVARSVLIFEPIRTSIQPWQRAPRTLPGWQRV